MPLQVHRRAGEACPRCGTTIEAVHFKDYVMCYCPAEQTGGRGVKDRRLSPLLKGGRSPASCPTVSCCSGGSSATPPSPPGASRSEERRVGEECRFRGAPCHS